MKIMASPGFLMLLCCASAALSGCAGVRDLAPGDGTAVMVRGRSYGEVWNAGLRIAERNLVVVETDRSAGVIRAHLPTSNSDYVSVFVVPVVSGTPTHIVEVVCGTNFPLFQVKDGWEAQFGLELRDLLPQSVPNRIRRHAWIVSTATEEFHDVFLDTLDGTTLSCLIDGREALIPIDSIAEIRQSLPTRVWRGAAIGAGVGLTAGLVVTLIIRPPGEFNDPNVKDRPDPYGPNVYHHGVLTGGAAGFLAGAAIGSRLGGDNVYGLSALNRDQKREMILSIMEREWTP